MSTIEIRIRSIIWLATAAVLAVAATVIVTNAWSATAAPGDIDSTFVPTAGCRLVDTRPATNVGPRATPLGAGDMYEIDVHGSNGKCAGPLAIPTDAVGVALNVTAVNATTASNLRIYPANLTDVPLLSNLNVTPGGPPTPNKVDVQLSPDGAIKVYNFAGSVDIVIDVVGYYTNTTLQELAQRVNALEAETDVLDANRSFSTSDLYPLATVSAPTDVASLTVNAPVAGDVTIVAATNAAEETASKIVACSISTASRTIDSQHEWFWQASTDATRGVIAGTRQLSVAANSQTTFYLVCHNLDPADASMVRESSLTAVFTPDDQPATSS